MRVLPPSEEGVRGHIWLDLLLLAIQQTSVLPDGTLSCSKHRGCWVAGGSVTSSVAEVFWTCVCWTKVKAVVDMDKAGVNVPCPNSPCKVTRTPPGQITRIWVETGLGVWKEVDLDRLISPAD
jgi:hypothetical protein